MNMSAGLRPYAKPVAALIFAGLLLLFAYGPLSGILAELNNDRISAWVAAVGPWGPVLIVALMVAAVVASPIPSGPIALAAGAAYGHVYGAYYVLAGAEIGALAAFGLARFLGRDVLHRWFGDKIDTGWLGSQNALTVTVFASRLMPFISFDIVSYAAGLSKLHFWRFGLATLAGIIPASFVFAHFGAEMARASSTPAPLAAIGLGGITLIPLVVVGVRDWRRQRLRHG